MSITSVGAGDRMPLILGDVKSSRRGTSGYVLWRIVVIQQVGSESVGVYAVMQCQLIIHQARKR